MRIPRFRQTLAPLLLGLLLAAPLGAAPRGISPSDVVRLVYADHQPWEGKEIDWTDPVEGGKYFDRSLVELFRKDRAYAERTQEIPCLDGDPILDAQDYDDAGITPITIRETKTKSGVLCEVSFTGRSEAWKNWNVRLTYDVRKSAKGWRIYDILSARGDSLRELLSCSDESK